MSQLIGDMNLNLANGFTFCMVGEISATLQNRRKVIFEVAKKTDLKPIITIQLDNQDFLEILVYDESGQSIKTTSVSPNKFATFYINRARQKGGERPIFLVVRMTAPVVDASNNNASIGVEVLVDNKSISCTTITGNFQWKNEEASHSIGAAVTGSDPATFILANLMILNRPIYDEELDELSGYTKANWGVGDDTKLLITKLMSPKIQLFVEDMYVQIYKTAWLKTMDIDCTEQTIETDFASNSNFTITGLHGAGRVSSYLRSPNPEIYQGNIIFGLFDFDKEGTENFWHLKKENFWENNVFGEKHSGFFRKRSDYDRCFGLLLPIPKRLNHLADLNHANFSNFVEVENLLPESFLRENSFALEKNIVGQTYLEVKDSAKNNLWKNAILLPKEDFLDFVPLFETLKDLSLQVMTSQKVSAGQRN